MSAGDMSGPAETDEKPPADNIVWLDFNDAPDQCDWESIDLRAQRDEIKARVIANLVPFLRWVFPNGVVKGRKFYVGNLQGDPGRSLEIELEGEKAGVFIDRATGDSGDVFTILAYHAGLDVKRDFRKVLAAAARWFGSDWLALYTEPPPRKANGKAVRDGFGLPTATWEYLSAEGKPIARVCRFDPPTGKTYRPNDLIRGVAGTPNPRPLYNLPGIVDAEQVILVEGEKCAQALVDIGICATTAMSGAKAPVGKTDWSPLQGKAILIWPDKDKPGWEYAEATGHAALGAGAVSCAILLPPEGKPEKWDAADAIAEGFSVLGFIATSERITLQPSVPETPEETAEQSVWGSEDALALEFTRRYFEDWRYCAEWGKWLVWTGQRWRIEHTLCASHLIRQICRETAVKTNQHRVAVKLASSGTAGGAERLARTDRRHAATADEWDADPWLLNSPGGVVDLRTGLLRPPPPRGPDDEDHDGDPARRLPDVDVVSQGGDEERWRAYGLPAADGGLLLDRDHQRACAVLPVRHWRERQIGLREHPLRDPRRLRDQRPDGHLHGDAE